MSRFVDCARDQAAVLGFTRFWFARPGVALAYNGKRLHKLELEMAS